ncbi:hypothetical protein SSABA_v1c03680 [Spiroplasma sabaudiense Ar-1343]|uniref:Uncharacterized protein n=1 Tax=Spiroplasma sabaudiense Ar-1343 TaxID=1276257 RepID=W6A9S7_9MOLU|nr:hypothetical protein SSABA_v1c03680 [Spiroplasma sabaudiense Ar-1343]
MISDNSNLGKPFRPYGHEATSEEIAKFTLLIPHHEWFSKLYSESAIGYTTSPNGTGLCEYISISMLFFIKKYSYPLDILLSKSLIITSRYTGKLAKLVSRGIIIQKHLKKKNLLLLNYGK